jgi:anti-sigma B factor antagonist
MAAEDSMTENQPGQLSPRSDGASPPITLPQFDMTEDDQDGVLRLALEGELDLLTASALEDRLNQLAAQKRRVRLDLSELQFIDSAGIGALVGALTTAQDNGWALEVIPTFSAQVTRVLSLVGVDRLIRERRTDQRADDIPVHRMHDQP